MILIFKFLIKKIIIATFYVKVKQIVNHLDTYFEKKKPPGKAAQL